MLLHAWDSIRTVFQGSASGLLLRRCGVALGIGRPILGVMLRF
jgi:hypothetical protein